MPLTRSLTEDLKLSLDTYYQEFIALRPNHEWRDQLQLLEKYEKTTASRSDGDSLFGEYGVGCLGNGHFFIKDRPYERMVAYSRLLWILKRYDRDRFSAIHKGTPYYFLGWVCFQANNFEESMFYLDSAASEDIRLGDHSSPAVSYFLLREKWEATGYSDLHLPTYSIIDQFINTFTDNTRVAMSREEMSSLFLNPLLFNNVQTRSLITALFGFILDDGSYERHINLRSSNGGSVEPFINHLFKGARILESLLKLKASGEGLDQLVKKLPKLEVDPYLLKGGKNSFVSAINAYDALKSQGKTVPEHSFAVSYIVRNIAGHSLVWSDEFQDTDNYLKLTGSVKNAIMWSIYKLWIEREAEAN